jgi:hypothetical protein
LKPVQAGAATIDETLKVALRFVERQVLPER